MRLHRKSKNHRKEGIKLGGFEFEMIECFKNFGCNNSAKKKSIL